MDLDDQLVGRLDRHAHPGRVLDDALTGRPGHGHARHVHVVPGGAEAGPAEAIGRCVVQRLHDRAVRPPVLSRRLRIDHERDEVMDDRRVARRDGVAGQERIRGHRRVEREAAVLVELGLLSALRDRREQRRRHVDRARQRGLRRQRQRDRRSLGRALVDPGGDDRLLIVGQRRLVDKVLAAAVVDHEVGRHGAGRGPLLFERGVRLRVGVVVEAEGRDAALLMTAHALVVVDRRHVLPERDVADGGRRRAAAARDQAPGQQKHTRDQTAANHPRSPFSRWDRAAPLPVALGPMARHAAFGGASIVRGIVSVGERSFGTPYSRRMSKVLVTGGSGFVGSHCIVQLLAAGHEVRTTVRSLRARGRRARDVEGGRGAGRRSADVRGRRPDPRRRLGASSRRLRLRLARRVAVSRARPRATRTS